MHNGEAYSEHGQGTPIVSVVVATHNRETSLKVTLAAMSVQEFQAPWELVVVENACSDGTLRMLASLAAILPLRVLSEPRRSKSRAVNRALEMVRGRLVVFADDDVTPTRRWLGEYAKALDKYPEARVLCGKIIPQYPPNTPTWVTKSMFMSQVLGAFFPPQGEGWLLSPWLPFGANFAAHHEVFDNERLRLDLGPSEDSDLMSEDTEFMRRLRSKGERFVYLPKAEVVHRLEECHVSLDALRERIFRLGRSLIVQEEEIDIPDLVGSTDNPYETLLKRSYCHGQLFQLRLKGDLAGASKIIAALGGTEEEERRACALRQ